MKFMGRGYVLLALAAVALSSGCQSPYHADQGALFGGLVGAGSGAIIGNQVGSPGAGAAIGAAIGTLTGAAVGSELDNIEARNAANVAAIEQRLGRQLAAGAATVDDVIAMTNAGVDEELIVNHIRNNGTAVRLQAADVISLQQQGVSKRVIAALQAPPSPQQQMTAAPVVVQSSAPPPLIVEEYHYGPPYWGPGPYYYHRPHYHRRPSRPGVSWGFTYRN
ncbi:MAG: YMGG-like glycine zipper-containing protein [Thermoguttaceae bacterium]|jgi:hypothetical protein|nr:YMGG-like glycine zipper-containing protein [Thermoguttaceae bacterium]